MKKLSLIFLISVVLITMVSFAMAEGVKPNTKKVTAFVIPAKGRAMVNIPCRAIEVTGLNRIFFNIDPRSCLIQPPQ